MADQQASIRIRVLGGIRAALEAESVADAMDQLADQTDQAARAAVRAAFAFKAMQRWLRKTFTQANLTAVAMNFLTLAMTGAKIVALGLATLALPALAIALYNVAIAAGVLTVAFLGGFLAIAGAAVFMAVAVVDRFKQMSGVIGSAAYDLQNAAYAIRGAFRDATAGGADNLMRGLASGLQKLVPLLRSLESSFTAIGSAFGSTFDRMFGRAAGAGPELRAMFAQLVPVIKAGGEMLGTLLGFLVQIGTVGAPLVADAFEWLNRKLQGWTGSFTDGRLDRAKQTLKDFADGVKAFAVAFAAPIKPFFADAMSEFGASWKTLGPAIGAVLGNIVAGLMQIGRKALPYVTKGMSWLADKLPGVIAWIGKAASSLWNEVIKPMMPFLSNVLWPLVKGIGKSLAATFGIVFKVIGFLARGLGWVGENLEPLKGTFETLGQIIGFVFGGPILKGLGAVISGIAGVGRGGGIVFRFLGGIISGFVRVLGGVATVVGRVAGAIVKGLGNALKWVWNRLSGIQKFIVGLAGGISAAAETMWGGIGSVLGVVLDGVKSAFNGAVNVLIGIINWLIRAYNGSAGKIPGAPQIAEIKPVGGGDKDNGGRAPGGAPSVAQVFPAAPSAPAGRTSSEQAAAARSRRQVVTRQPVVVQVNGRQIAEAVQEWTEQQEELVG